jgi:hypothetical protein
VRFDFTIDLDQLRDGFRFRHVKYLPLYGPYPPPELAPRDGEPVGFCHYLARVNGDICLSGAVPATAYIPMWDIDAPILCWPWVLDHVGREAEGSRDLSLLVLRLIIDAVKGLYMDHIDEPIEAFNNPLDYYTLMDFGDEWTFPGSWANIMGEVIDFYHPSLYEGECTQPCCGLHRPMD